MNTSPFTLEQAQDFLKHYGQTHLFHLIAELPQVHKQLLLEQLKHLSTSLPVQPELPKAHFCIPKDLTPFNEPKDDSPLYTPLGEAALKKGQVLGILLAGGDGSRLGFDQPKGCFPISPIMKKSLFQLHCEKILALQKHLKVALPLAILTSPLNYQATVAYFKHHDFFGLDSGSVLFLQQPMLPLYNTQQQWFFKNAHELSLAPNGNGGLLTALKTHWGAFNNYHYFTITNIDNALATLYDNSLIGAQMHHNADIALRCFKHNPLHDKVGVLAFCNNHLCIVDYTAIEDRSAFPYGNINTFCCSKLFINQLLDSDELPIHWVEKKGISYDPSTCAFNTIMTLKGEQFLSDAIALARHPIALDSLAEEHFAPLKNLKGINDVASVQKALLRRDQRILHDLTGLNTSASPIELSMDFYYPDEMLIQKCHILKKLPDHGYLSRQLLEKKSLLYP